MTDNTAQISSPVQIKNHNWLAIVLALISGALLMHIASGYLANSGLSKKHGTPEYIELSNQLIELEGGITAGINVEQFGESMKKISIAANKYKLLARPNDKEIAVLNEIIADMRHTQDYWKVMIPYNCMGKNPSQTCVFDFARSIYKLTPGLEHTEEQYLNLVSKSITEDKAALEDRKGEIVSYNLTFTGLSIKKFFKLHGVDL